MILKNLVYDKIELYHLIFSLYSKILFMHVSDWRDVRRENYISFTSTQKRNKRSIRRQFGNIMKTADDIHLNSHRFELPVQTMTDKSMSNLLCTRIKYVLSKRFNEGYVIVEIKVDLHRIFHAVDRFHFQLIWNWVTK